jgi:anti-sigma regulatory factor (Ser/Thr protein kinase)
MLAMQASDGCGSRELTPVRGLLLGCCPATLSGGVHRAAHGGVGCYPAMCRRSYPGRADQVPRVRAFLAQVLAGCPAADAELLADELAANAVIHSHSGEPGGVLTVHVELCDGQWVRVGIEDEGGPTPPRLRTSGTGVGDDAVEGGKGLRIVAALADAWGVTGDVVARTV